MANLTLNSALQGIRGRIDNWVYRKFGDRVIIARRPTITAAPSPAQQAVRDRFKVAAAYARAVLADPVQQARYEAAARVKGTQAYALVVGDFLKPPVVHAIDASGYHGLAGDLIKVEASDDFEVVAVGVVIRDATDAILEQGLAALVEGRWTYAATAAVAPGESVTIEATATDRPGHSGAKLVTWTNG